ncbi:MAG: hypothetical protein HRU12_22020 [Phaeodactylibacter sp.]|nr:hypothetical protein [Phaeodactylibacter sp.]
MQQGLSFHSILLATDQLKPKEQDKAEMAPPSGIQPGAPSAVPEPAEAPELKGRTALLLSTTGIIAFLMGYFAIGWILAFAGFIAAGTQILAAERGRYWPAQLALTLTTVFVISLLGFILYYS